LGDDKSLNGRAAAAFEQWITTQGLSAKESAALHPDTQIRETAMLLRRGHTPEQVIDAILAQGHLGGRLLRYDGEADKRALQIEFLCEFARDELTAEDALAFERRFIGPLRGHEKPSYDQLAAETGRPVHDLYKAMELCRRKLQRPRFAQKLRTNWSRNAVATGEYLDRKGQAKPKKAKNK
jgi:hypothetical protein